MKEENIINALFEDNPIPMMITDANKVIIRVNRSFSRFTGYEKDEALGKSPGQFSSKFTPRDTYTDMWSSINATGFWHGKVWNTRKDGQIYPAMLFITRCESDGFAASFHDVSLEQTESDSLHLLINHDPLTKLVNRTAIFSYLGKLVNESIQTGEHVAVMYLDMNKFKNVNDLLGHTAGDELLVEAARRMSAIIRGNDMVGRIGGDEFVILLSGTNPLVSSHVANRIKDELSRPYQLSGKEVRSAPSIGVSIYPQDGRTPEELLHNADTAMYQSKATFSYGLGEVRFFSHEMNKDVLEKIEIETDLHEALRRGELSLHYQPQIDMKTKRVSKVEALMRWTHPTKGLIPPDVFIPVAEESGAIVSIGGWVIEEALAEISEWRKHGVNDVCMCINLSSCQLKQFDLPIQIKEALDRYGLSGKDIEIEITESVAITNPEQATQMIESFQEIGVNVSMDDFGTGCSSLAYLKSLPIDAIKLDKTFVQHAAEDEHDAAISIAAINLAHNININITAEGVETEDQHQFLRKHGCDTMQGFLFCRPIPNKDAMSFVKRHNELIDKLTPAPA